MGMRKAQATSSVSREQGFTLGSLLIAVAVIAVVFVGYKYVSRAQRENDEQAKKISDALTGNDEEPAGDSSDSNDDPSYTDQSQLWENPISAVKVKSEPLTITLTATLPGSYQGTCTVEISQPDGTQKRRFVEQLKGTKTCSIYIPTSDLKDSKTWKYQFGYFSKDGRTYGKYPEATLSL